MIKGEGTIWETYNALTQFATHTPIWEHHDYRRINIMNGTVGLLKKKTDIDMQTPFIKYIANTQHYDDVLARVASVKKTLWIGTADIKDVYIKSGTAVVPLLAVFDKLVKRNVAIRLIHAKEPGPIFREEHEKFPALWSAMEMTLCPRVHFKLMIFDMETAYIVWANTTQ